MKKLRPIMFVGTGSDVGKSVINTGFCRMFVQDGYSPAPFKAQNMSLNSYATIDNLEIGRAQAVQAEACKIPCCVEMNPVLLKPTNNLTSQVVLNGKPSGNKSASEYFNETDRDALFEEVIKSYNRLSERHNPIVIEGAGSISEINLWKKDIVNMRVALRTGAATYLVADIDRGGVFASVYGTIALLPKEQREAIKGIIINKFRGDLKLFDEGRKIIEDLTGIPVVGVVPYAKDIFIEQEDGVAIDYSSRTPVADKINVGVVLLKYMSNFTDFNMLQQTPGVHLYYSDDPMTLSQADIIIIPGSKNTISDLIVLKEKGIDSMLRQHIASEKCLYGICGGYQMMGEKVLDPHGIEGSISEVDGLGIIPTVTVLEKGKQTSQCTFNFVKGNAQGQGYEIHAGKTTTTTPRPLCLLSNGEEDGYYLNDKVWGSYVHGIFDNASVITSVVRQIDATFTSGIDYKAKKEEGYDQLAQLIRDHIDIDYVYKTLEL